ncbi:hypothetical protein EW093_09285 [Thiospirochaeta perfilievii]|uniref:Uncharacterized protein n=1 Tax=Thiospirochaeta perfilievii TaxID=252967 RepID=A0A5C1QCV2_9SPIO|nr:hypothetical protein [Thiospirochaeta perfilievii]QEN04890.1 hypothetical protein EW093_09285 [Thiospirochaeta perfilievii]
MINIGSKLLEQKNFPEESDKNIITLHKKVKNGSLGVSLSSFEEIFNITPKGNNPFPVGAINFEDGKKRFVVSWIDDFSKFNIKDVDDYTLKIRNYPTIDYPVLSLMIGLNSGKIDPETKKDLWLFGEAFLDIAFMMTRIKLYQLLNCDEILFCLFDNGIECLDSFGFSLNRSEMELLLSEVNSVFELTNNMELENHISLFSKASKEVSSSFNHNGLPKSREALEIYLKRKGIEPKPEKHNWNDFLSI